MKFRILATIILFVVLLICVVLFENNNATTQPANPVPTNTDPGIRLY